MCTLHNYTYMHTYMLATVQNRRARFSILHWLLAVTFQRFLFRGVLQFGIFCPRSWNRRNFQCVKNLMLIWIILLCTHGHLDVVLCAADYYYYYYHHPLIKPCMCLCSTVARRIGSVSWQLFIWYCETCDHCMPMEFDISMHEASDQLQISTNDVNFKR